MTVKIATLLRKLKSNGRELSNITEEVPGIYVIINIYTYDAYVGQSVNVLSRCRNGHLNGLRCRTHYNEHLQRSFNKHGEEAFFFGLLQKVDTEKKGQELTDILNELEIKWIERLDTYETGYNQTLGGNSSCGYRHTAASKRKMSASRMGNKNGLGNKNSLGHKNFEGHTHSKETRKKISDSVKAYWVRKKGKQDDSK
jgi:group I intron endonuclease